MAIQLDRTLRSASCMPAPPRTRMQRKQRFKPPTSSPTKLPNPARSFSPGSPHPKSFPRPEHRTFEMTVLVALRDWDIDAWVARLRRELPGRNIVTLGEPFDR